MSSISEGSFEFSDSDEESKIATPIIRPMAKLAAPDDAGVDYFFITDSDTRSHSTHDIHLSLNGMTPSVTSAALTERSGTSSYGIKLHKTQDLVEEESLASLNSSDIDEISVTSEQSFVVAMTRTSDIDQAEASLREDDEIEHSRDMSVACVPMDRAGNEYFAAEESLASLSSDEDNNSVIDGTLNENGNCISVSFLYC